MRFATKLAVLAAVAAPVLVASLAAADGQTSGSVSGSATVSVGTPLPPPPPPAGALPPPPAGAQPPPPPVVYQPGPPPQPYGYGAPPPPPPPPAPPPGDYLHDGFYMRFALGGGGFGASGSVEPTNRSGNYKISGGGLGLTFALGGTPTPGLTLGGELFFQQSSKPTVTFPDGSSLKAPNDLNFGLIGPFIDWYPNAEGGFHVGGMLGLASMTVSDPNGNTKDSRLSGGGGALSIGYDFWVGRQLSLGVLGKVFGGSVSRSDLGITEKYSVSGGSLFLSILYH